MGIEQAIIKNLMLDEFTKNSSQHRRSVLREGKKETACDVEPKY